MRERLVQVVGEVALGGKGSPRVNHLLVTDSHPVIDKFDPAHPSRHVIPRASTDAARLLDELGDHSTDIYYFSISSLLLHQQPIQDKTTWRPRDL